MSSKAPAAPPPPDPVATAKAQSEFNLDAARQTASMNRINQFTPQGSSTFRRVGSDIADRGTDGWLADNPGLDRGSQEYKGWREAVINQNGGQDQWEQTVALSPEQQRLYDQSVEGQTLYGDAALSQLRSVQDTLSQPFQFNGPEFTGNVQDRTGQMQYGVQDRTGQIRTAPDFTGIGDPNQSRDAVQEALMARINPDLERERAALESRLANQGITMGSQAWNTGMQDYSRQANDARYGAILNAGQEQSRMFGLGMQQAGFNNEAVNQAYGMDMGRAQFGNQAIQQAYGMDIGRGTFGNQARQQSLQEQLALRSQPINEASALLTGAQVQMPQFQNYAQVGVQAPDYAGGVGQNYAGQTAQWNATSQRIGQENASKVQAVSSIAMAAAMAF